MANYCDYEIRVKGNKKACLMVYESMPYMDFKDLDWERKEGNSYLISFTGNCKWSVNYGVKDGLKRINIDSLSESEIENSGTDYWEYSLRAKSEAFQCEIMVHYWSTESEFDQFDHYKNGEVLKQRKIAFNYDEQTEFDWERLEFVGHEGEYDESIDGEQQDANFMSMLLGLGKNSDDMSEDDESSLEEIKEKLDDLLSQMEDLAAEAGINLHDSSIGETGFDLYNWTFTQGKRQEGNGWAIAIPDGFTVIPSEDRLFEAVPCGMEDSDQESIPVHIYPGIEQEFKALSRDNWMYHPYARAGVAEILAVQSSKLVAQLMGSAPEILSTGFSDVCAYILIQDTTGGSYSYQAMVITDGKSQLLRVQTQFITDEQKKKLNISIKSWIETFRFDKENPSIPKETKLESEKVFNDLKCGVTGSFEEAVDCAQKEYLATVNGRLGTLHFLAEYGLLNDDTPDTAREILTHGMEVKEFYYLKADELVEKLKKLPLKTDIMKRVYKKLDELKEGLTELTVDDNEITVSLPAKVKDIQNKWKKEAAEITKLEKAKAEEARKKAEEERKKAEAKRKEELRKYNEAHKQWESECADINAKRSAFVDAKIAEEKAQIVDAATKRRDDAIAKTDAILKEQTARKSSAESALASLSMFKFSAKKDQKAIIEDAVKLLTNAEESRSAAEVAYSAEMRGVDQKAASKRSAFQKAAEKEFPLPIEPKKPR